jgi:mono/diheme cytochrome c family protein
MVRFGVTMASGWVTAAICGAVALTACGDASTAPDESLVDATDGEESAPMSEGEEIFRSRVEDGNTFTCATCHATSEPADDGFRRPGHALGDAAARPTFKNGQVADLREAAGSCLQEWMNADAWTADDPRWIALRSYLTQTAPDDAPPLSFQIVAPPADLEGGDEAAGQTLFNDSCAVCHGIDGGGTQLAPPVAGLSLDPGYVAARVRTSGRADSSVYEGLTGGVMPFWAADRLSDDELRDLVAWLANSEPAPMPSDDGGSDSDDGGDGSSSDDGSLPSDCGSTHPRVGQTALMTANFHDVGGIAEIIDDCTIEIRDFTFDGQGVDVRLYGGLGGDFDAGFGMGEDLRRAEPYEGETLTFTLPAGQTLDDLDGVSVWCVPVGVDFGSGFFQ